jgi:hypothetical protein
MKQMQEVWKKNHADPWHSFPTHYGDVSVGFDILCIQQLLLNTYHDNVFLAQYWL